MIVLGENGMEKKNRPLRTGSLFIHIGRRVRRKNGSPDRFQQGTAHCTAIYIYIYMLCVCVHNSDYSGASCLPKRKCCFIAPPCPALDENPRFYE